MPRPLADAIFEDLKHSWPNVMLCIEPRYRYISVEGSLPLETAVG
jgi:hypothetical protein